MKTLVICNCNVVVLIDLHCQRCIQIGESTFVPFSSVRARAVHFNLVVLYSACARLDFIRSQILHWPTIVVVSPHELALNRPDLQYGFLILV